ncbi:MAG TPA: Fe-S-containing protein, partial [Candidatus Binataceae bacterium]|nr:Fe-S-containing protein [Candidatus Binataceae bacterium]
MRRPKLKLRAGLIIVAIAALGAAMLTLPPRCIKLGPAELLNIPVANLARGDAQTYCYEDRAGEKIRFILARDSDGNIHSAFDACSQCYSFHKGYKVTGGAIV